MTVIEKRRKHKSSVLILGSGIAGITAAERLGNAGVQVHLVEKETDIGGHIREMGCKAADVCLRCNVCVANKILRVLHVTPNVFLYTRTQLAQLLQGKNGHRFTAVLTHQSSKEQNAQFHVSPRLIHSPLYTDSKLAKAGMMAGAGPARKAQSVVDVDYIIIAIGYEPYNPTENSSYGYGHIPNVITAIDAERQLSADSRITRVSDSQLPGRIAFIQCVGSRTWEIYRRPEDTDYCSTVCCSYALRMARQMKYHSGNPDITIFYMDIQNFGKGFNAFYSNCKSNMNFVRARPCEIKAGKNGMVLIRYAPENSGSQDKTCVCESEFDLVVLSVGMRPPADSRALADILGVPLDEHGFFGLKGASDFPDLQKRGIFAIGASESPKDIAGCIAQAKSVSAEVIASH